MDSPSKYICSLLTGLDVHLCHHLSALVTLHYKKMSILPVQFCLKIQNTKPCKFYPTFTCILVLYMVIYYHSELDSAPLHTHTHTNVPFLSPISYKCNLIWGRKKKVFADVIKSMILRWNHPRWLKWALSPMAIVLTGNKKWEETDSEVKAMWRWSKDWCWRPPAQDFLEPPEAWRRSKDSPPESSEEAWLCWQLWFWTSGSRTERVNYYHLKSSVWKFVMTVLGTNKMTMCFFLILLSIKSTLP